MKAHNIFSVVITLYLSMCLNAALHSTDRYVDCYNVKQFGATGNGTDYDTEAVQQAIDAATLSAGGVVWFPPGKYLLKTVILKDNVTISVDRGAIILGSKELNSFDPQFGSFVDSGIKFGISLFFAKDAHHIAIEGDGVIDGQGFVEFYPKKEGIHRPSIIRFLRCRDVKIENVTLVNSATWVQHYVECDDLTIRGITVNSYSNVNNDGLNIEGCHRVIITQCNINSEDDSIVLKALSTRSCRDIVISDCIVSGLKSAIKTGTESAGGFENISISNCVFYGTRGLTFYTVDGGDINGITVSNITMRDTYGILSLRLGDRMEPYTLSSDEKPKSPGKLRNVMISNVQATGVTESNDFISGIPGHWIENVTIDNFRISFKGGGTKADSEREIPELTNEYPKPRMFGIMPSYGLYIRHAKNIKISDVFLSVEEPDKRSVILCDDVSNLELSGVQAQSTSEAAPFFWLKNVKGAWIHGCKPLNAINSFIRIEGEQSEKIFLSDNFLNLAKQDIITGKGAKKSKISRKSNY